MTNLRELLKALHDYSQQAGRDPVAVALCMKAAAALAPPAGEEIIAATSSPKP